MQIGSRLYRRPDRGGNTGDDEVDDDIDVIPYFQSEPDSGTVCQSRHFDGISIGTLDRFNEMVAEIQAAVEDQHGTRPGIVEARALPGLAFAAWQRRAAGTVKPLQELQEFGVNQPDCSGSLHFITSPAGLSFIEETATGSSPKKDPRRGSTGIGQCQTMKLGLRALVEGDISIGACSDVYGAFHRA